MDSFQEGARRFGSDEFTLAPSWKEFASCPVQEIVDACGFYARVIERV